LSKLVELYGQTLRHLLMPIQPLLDDESVSEVMVNGHDEVFIERAGKIEKTDACFANEHELEAAVRNIAQYVGKRLVPEVPSIEARLPDGSRVHIVQAPSARKGLCMAIRKFSKHKLDLAGLISKGALTEEAGEFLGLCVALAKNVIVSGGTGSGKTTLLNCLSSMIDSSERIIVLEDSSELQLQQEHVVPFEAQAPDRYGRGGIDIRELFRASLRMRPDRVVVGECRGAETLDMIQAMTSGHSGSLSTCHANSPRDALNRLETMALMGDVGLPLQALRAQLSSAVDIVVQINRFHDGARKVTAITEVMQLDVDGQYQIRDIFTLGNASGVSASQRRLEFMNAQPTFAGEVFVHGMEDRIGSSMACWAKS